MQQQHQRRQVVVVVVVVVVVLLLLVRWRTHNARVERVVSHGLGQPPALVRLRMVNWRGCVFHRWKTAQQAPRSVAALVTHDTHGGNAALSIPQGGAKIWPCPLSEMLQLEL